MPERVIRAAKKMQQEKENAQQAESILPKEAAPSASSTFR
jgi:hypothetical protein